MVEEFVTLTALVVVQAGGERELLRRSLSQAQVPLDIVEIDDVTQAAASVALLERQLVDIVLLDAAIDPAARAAIAAAVAAADGRPLLVLVGATAAEMPQLAAIGVVADGVLGRPLVPAATQALIDGCVRARFPNRVLIVDDSSTVRSVVRKVLQASRFQLETEEAADGTAALERVRATPFDILFLDCNMPGLDGWGTLAELRQRHPDVRVVMITATNDEATRTRAKSAGAHDLLFKPFYAKDIDAVLNRLFGLTPPVA